MIRTGDRSQAVCEDAASFESQGLRCVGFSWAVRANDPALVDDVTDLYRACLDHGPARHRFVLWRRGHSGDRHIDVYRDDLAVLRRASRELALAHLAWEVNQGVVAESGGRLLLHAAAAEQDGVVVLLPGPQGSGKSTVVAGLVRAGLGYVTDEAVAVDRSTATIEPYPKPIALDASALSALGDPWPGPDPDGHAWLGQRLVAPQSIRPDAVSGDGGAVHLIVLPTFRRGQRTTIEAISRSEAAVSLAQNAFNFETSGRGALKLVARLVRESECYRLEFGELDDACGLVLALFDAAMARP
jgi:hypothetical protein